MQGLNHTGKVPQAREALASWGPKSHQTLLCTKTKGEKRRQTDQDNFKNLPPTILTHKF